MIRSDKTHLFSFLCSPIICIYVLISCCDVRYDFSINMMFDLSLPPVVCRRAHVFFTLLVFALRTLVSKTYCVVFLFCFYRLVYPMLPVSMDFPLLIALSVFSNVYLLRNTRLSIHFNS